MNSMLSLLSHDWAGLVPAVVLMALGAWWWRKSRLKRSIWRAASSSIVLGVGVLLAVAAVYHLMHMSRVRSEHPAPGKLVDVGGYRIHLLAEGDARGKPAVVWMPGAHGAGFYFHHLHRALRAEARSILIDRPGAGWSDIGPFPRTTAGEAEEVVKALEQAGEAGPYVLVGHSLGGLLMANIARRHPDKVASVVLLDATPPDAINYAPPNPFLSQMRRDAMWSAVQKLFGLHSDVVERLSGSEPDPATQRIIALTAARLGSAYHEVRAIEDGARAMTANASIFDELRPGGMDWHNTVYDGDLGDLPVYLVAPGELQELASMSKAMVNEGGAASRAALDAQRLQRFYQRTRERYMAASTRTQRIYAPQGTGHNFPYETPEFVIETIRRVLTQPPPEDGAEFDLILHSQVVIKAPPSVVWEHLDRLQEWKPSVVSLERIEGARNEVGEVLRIGQKPANETVYVLQKTLQVEPNRRKVQTLTTEDGRTTNGYVIYSLVPEGGGTRVMCDLVARASVPAAALNGRSPAELSRLASAGTKAKLDADHQALKQLIERAPERQ